MSYYYEYKGSGEGDSTGLSGLDASRTFVVVIDKVGDDPITVIHTAEPRRKMELPLARCIQTVTASLMR